jgi:hypothetical protein
VSNEKKKGAFGPQRTNLPQTARLAGILILNASRGTAVAFFL